MFCPHCGAPVPPESENAKYCSSCGKPLQPEEAPKPVFVPLRTNRSLTKYFWLSVVTLGIYGIVVMSHISEEINKVAAEDGKHTMHYCLIFFLFSWLTLGIAPLVWYTRLCNRIGDQMFRDRCIETFSGWSYWGWDVFGSAWVAGPFIFIHQLMKCMNMINRHYNEVAQN